MADKITEKMIAKLQLPAKGNRIQYDKEIPGFGVRITSGGVVSFIINYHIHGRERRFTIGRHPELSAAAARQRALQLRGAIADGSDPLEDREQRRAEPTVADLASQYLDRYAVTHKRPSSVRNDRQIIQNIIQPRIGGLRLAGVGKRDIGSLHASLKGTPYHANRMLSLLSKMFSLANEWGWCEHNPARGVPRFHEDRRERWLTVEELRRFNLALDSYPDRRPANALRLLMLTGARASEVLRAEWAQFDLERGVWTKPSHHTKQKRIEHVPLSAPALKLLHEMKPKVADGPLFPGTNKHESRVTVWRPWLQVCKAAGLVNIETKKGKRRKTVYKYRPTLRIHDLRHTYASQLVSNGISLQVVGKLLGHTQPQTTWRYAHVADEAQRDATNLFGDILEGGTR
ncbi:MAG: Integrase [Acidobacteriaceae bacterium]|nr:Integrase [Acidobacteriaceae bacterium]